MLPGIVLSKCAKISEADKSRGLPCQPKAVPEPVKHCEPGGNMCHGIAIIFHLMLSFHESPHQYPVHSLSRYQMQQELSR